MDHELVILAAYVGYCRLMGDANELITRGDLSIGGREISDSGDDDVQQCASATLRRHRAIVWMLGGYPVYSQTPVAT